MLALTMAVAVAVAGQAEGGEDDGGGDPVAAADEGNLGGAVDPTLAGEAAGLREPVMAISLQACGCHPTRKLASYHNIWPGDDRPSGRRQVMGRPTAGSRGGHAQENSAPRGAAPPARLRSVNNRSLAQAGSTPNCLCGIPAQELSVVKESANKGRKFWTCGHHPEKKCQYFDWVTGTSASTTQSGPDADGFTRPVVPAKRPLVRTRRSGLAIDFLAAQSSSRFRLQAGIDRLMCPLDANATNRRSHALCRRKGQIKVAPFGAVRNHKGQRAISSLG